MNIKLASQLNRNVDQLQKYSNCEHLDLAENLLPLIDQQIIKTAGK